MTLKNGLVIEIWASDNDEGYMYEIYSDRLAQENCESLDGGLCTGDLEDALEMAYEQAGALIE